MAALLHKPLAPRVLRFLQAPHLQPFLVGRFNVFDHHLYEVWSPSFNLPIFLSKVRIKIFSKNNDLKAKEALNEHINELQHELRQ